MSRVYTIPVAAPANDAVIEHRESSIYFERDIRAAAPEIITAYLGFTLQNHSNGTKGSVSLFSSGVPGTSQFSAGPKVTIGGISLGLLANIAPNLNISASPQIGIGGMTYLHGAGVCSGFWCVGGSGAATIPWQAMLFIGAIEVATSIFQTEREDLSSLPLVVVARLLSNLIPVKQVVSTLSTLHIPTGMGPAIKPIKTLDDLRAFHRAINTMINFNARTDAIRKVAAQIQAQDDPYVRADLMELLDKLLVERNTFEIPTITIETNIRRAVEGAEAFTQKYARWLKAETGASTPTEREIHNYMAYALYLANKLYMETEEKKEGRRTVIKIRRSAPFQINDPELAVRFIEVTGNIFKLLADRNSALSTHITARGASIMDNLLNQTNSPMFGEGLLEAESARAWHATWLSGMALAYEGGFFYRRRAHMRWLASSKASGTQKESLLARLRSVTMPILPDFLANIGNLSSSLADRRYKEIAPAIDMLITVADLEHEPFAGYEGDGGLLFDAERARQWARRVEIVDVFYKYSALHKALIRGKLQLPANRLASFKDIMRTAILRLIGVMRREVPEVRREWSAYANSSKLERDLKPLLLKRIDEAQDEIRKLNPNGLLELVKTSITDTDSAEVMARYLETLAKDLQSVESNLEQLSRDAAIFRSDMTDIDYWKDFYATEETDSQKIADAILEWRSFLSRYEAIKTDLKRLARNNKDHAEKVLKEWDEKIAKISEKMEKIARNYERFNAKRVGVALMETYFEISGIDPATPKEDTVIDELFGHTRGLRRFH